MLTWITEKELEREIKKKETNLESQREKFISGVARKKMRNVRGQ